MKRCLLLACLALSQCVLAQSPPGIVLQRLRANVNEPVKVVVNFEVASNWCGLRLDFGDGDVRDMVVEEFPITLTKQYASAGRFVLHAEGRIVPRGRSSAPGCDGASRRAAITVADPRRDAPSPVATPDAAPAAPPPGTRWNPGGAPPRPPAANKRPRDDSLKVF